jgi:hypothetical protein
MQLMRLGKEKNINKPTERITFEHNGFEYTITPEYKGFRVHKHSLDDGIIVRPSYNNEIIVE